MYTEILIRNLKCKVCVRVGACESVVMCSDSVEEEAGEERRVAGRRVMIKGWSPHAPK